MGVGGWKAAGGASFLGRPNGGIYDAWMSKGIAEVNVEAIRRLAMDSTEFWELIDSTAKIAGFNSLIMAVDELSWKKLLAYDIRMRFVLSEGLRQVLEGAEPSETETKEYVPRLVHILLQGRSAWEQLSAPQLDQIDLEQETVDFNQFFTHVERTYIKKFYFGSGILRTNPVAVTNGIMNFKLLTSLNPWDEIL